jgi:hypothetical protein
MNINRNLGPSHTSQEEDSKVYTFESSLSTLKIGVICLLSITKAQNSIIS